MTHYADGAALIDDPRVHAVPIADIGEPLVDARHVSEIVVDLSRDRVQTYSDNPFQIRTSVAERLLRAQCALPSGLQLQLKEGWRPRWVQERLWKLNLDRLLQDRPGLDVDALAAENARFVAPPDRSPPHSTGGAVDVVLLRDGMPVDAGWGFNEPGEGSRSDATVSGIARTHRRELTRAMHAAGFINYPQEWWHWSYGDQYWAFQCGATSALFGSC